MWHVLGLGAPSASPADETSSQNGSVNPEFGWKKMDLEPTTLRFGSERAHYNATQIKKKWVTQPVNINYY